MTPTEPAATIPMDGTWAWELDVAASRFDPNTPPMSDAYAIRTTTKRAGEVTATSTRQVSKDGRTMTITLTGTDEKGVAFNNTLVFRKRERP